MINCSTGSDNSACTITAPSSSSSSSTKNTTTPDHQAPLNRSLGNAMQDPNSNNANYNLSNQPNINNASNLIAGRLQAEQQQQQRLAAAAAGGAPMALQQSTATLSEQQQHQQEMDDQRHGSSASSAPCGACKFLRRKCLRGCVFAPYFLSEQGTESFCAVHKVFGASNVSKLLLRIPLPEQRRQAVLTIKYEAQARLLDPIYGCVRTIIALQRQVQYLQTELEMVRAQLSTCHQQLQQQQQQQQQLVNLQQIITAGPSSSTVQNINPNNYSTINNHHPAQTSTPNLLLMQDPNYMINSNYTNSSSSAIVNGTATQPANSINNSAVYNMANLPDPSCNLLQDHEVINDNYNRAAAANSATISACTPSQSTAPPSQMMINYNAITNNHANISSPLYSASCDDQQDSVRNNQGAIYDNRLIYDSSHHQDYL